jgi:CRP-like cAMP-binding protein
MIAISLDQHPQRNVIRLELRHNVVLGALTESDRAELERHLVIVDARKGEALLHQGVHAMEQYFVLDGILKRVVTNAEAKEMILRFADKNDIETSYAAWRLNTPTPYSIVCVSRAQVAKLAMPVWVDFLDERPQLKLAFEYEVMRVMSETYHHLHLLDAWARTASFKRPNWPSASREGAAYLNLSAETLAA